jgi:hypothetical protein
MDIYSDSHASCGPGQTQGEDVPSTGLFSVAAEGTEGIRVDWRLALAYFTVGVAALLLF